MRVGTAVEPDWIKWNLVHELGHALGLNHNMVDAKAVMASPHWCLDEGRLPTTAPTPDEKRALEHLYQ